jgi:YVTN family beta-propeller protein
MMTFRKLGAAFLLLTAAELIAICASASGPPMVPPAAPVTFQHGTRETVRQLPQPSERWALVVGVGKYEDENVHELKGDRDAAAFARALEEHAGFRNDHITLLAGQHTQDCRPVRQGLEDDASEAASTAGPSSKSKKASQDCKPTLKQLLRHLHLMISEMPTTGLFVFFFSGHGQYVAGETVLFPSDLDYRDSDLDLRHQGLSGKEIAETIKEKGIKQVLIFLDACRDKWVEKKGVAEENPASPRFKEGFNLDTLNANVEAFMTFYSTTAGSPSYEDPSEKMSYFTSELVRAFDGRGDAYDARNLLTLGGLIRYVQTNVRSRVEAKIGKHQVPDYLVSGYLAEDLVLAGREAPRDTHPELLSGSSVLITPDGTRIWVANSRQGVLHVFDAATGKPQQVIDLRPGTPGKMVMAAQRGEIYVTEPVSQTVVVINAKHQRVVDHIPTGISPESLALTPDEAKLYVSNQQPAPVGNISVLDPVGRKAINTPITGVNCPEGLAMAPDGVLMYVETQCGFGDDPLFVVDTKLDKVVHSLPGFAVGGIALGMLPNGEKLYIGTEKPDRTSVLVTATGDVKALGRSGDPKAYARYFAATPDGKYVLGVGGSRYMLIIDTITDEVVNWKDLGTLGAGIAIGMAPGTNKAACYVWLPEVNQLFFTGLDGILSAREEH